MESGGFLTQKIILLIFHNTFIHSHYQAETSKNTYTHHDIIQKVHYVWFNFIFCISKNSAQLNKYIAIGNE